MVSLPEDEMHRLTRSLQTKSEKIRALGRAGVSPGDIGRFLGIRYQHAYNVLKQAGLGSAGNMVRDTDGASAWPAPAKAVLEESGCIRLPPHVLKAWSASPGDELLVHVEGDELRVLTRSGGLRLAQEILRKYGHKARGMADELIAERRREAERRHE